MKNKIIVVGGYGSVGQIICTELAKYFPGKVFAAGRSFKKAEAFTVKTNGAVKPTELDVTKALDKTTIEDTKLIIMCLDQTDTEFVKTVFEYGIDYMDITAGSEFLSEVEKLKKEAVTGGSTALLSVGLTPGLSNLMALEASRRLDYTASIDIAIMLGLGDQHGSAAIQWTLDNMNREFTWLNHGRTEKAISFTDGKKIYFGENLGYKRAYRFPFSDQHTIARTLEVPEVKTRLCFDSSIITEGVALMKAIGGLTVLKNHTVRNMTEKVMVKMPLGSDKYALKVEAAGKMQGREAKAEFLIEGHKEAEITGLVAAAAARYLYEGDYSKGVYHIEQLLDFSILPVQIMKMMKKRLLFR
jgi:saccharopine dehydrogenase-like NADP-dependent oxidoreductase